MITSRMFQRTQNGVEQQRSCPLVVQPLSRVRNGRVVHSLERRIFASDSADFESESERENQCQRARILLGSRQNLFSSFSPPRESPRNLAEGASFHRLNRTGYSPAVRRAVRKISARERMRKSEQDARRHHLSEAATSSHSRGATFNSSIKAHRVAHLDSS